MNYFIKQQLEIIAHEAEIQEKSAQRTKRAIRDILMFEFGAAYYDYFHNESDNFSSIPTPQLNQESNGYQEIVSTSTPIKTIEEIIREVKEMIIELQIKGSVREHRDGLLKFTSTMFDKPVYGRSKEEIEVKIKERLRSLRVKSSKNRKNLR